jgi:hypothetical protein
MRMAARRRGDGGRRGVRRRKRPSGRRAPHEFPLVAGPPVARVSGVPRFASFDTSTLRSASSAARLPWLGRSVTLLRVDATGVVQQAKTDSEKRSLLESATSKDLVLVAWPGQWSQEIYVVDDLRAARAAVRVRA